MNRSDERSFTILMQGVYALYRADLSDAVLAIWWEAMRSFSFAVVRDALNRHAVNADTGQFLPKPADVVKLANGSSKDVALIAWTKAMRAVSEVGAYRSVDFDDSLVSVVIRDMGGWPAFCGGDVDELGYRQNEFVTRYRGYATRGELLPSTYLPGIVELQNRAAGFGVPEPVLIGNRARRLGHEEAA